MNVKPMPAALSAAVLFPGQGADVSGSAPLVEALCADLLSRARELLEADPLEHAAESTLYAQPAIFLASLAGWREVQAAGVQPVAFAGHSLGEITALTAAGALAPEDALELVILRARLMHEVCSASHGGMLAVLTGSVEQAERLALAHGLRVANYNAPGETVLSGATAALDAAARDARAIGLRALRLNVSGAFHTPALRPARVRFAQALAGVAVRRSDRPVLSAMTALPFTDPARQLATALIQPVRWTEAMRTLDRLGARAYLDVGPGRVLERLARRNLGEIVVIDRDALRSHALGTS